ncbi:MAG TPA: 5-methyltetrahydropteroyltriglutamate--homocysteine S-methyltransferase [Caulobacteraceae bacterium]|nr:5-methyltetrahydropteroyltriglutamate--homocysteine S-methyltransferase [Caulobacteraceae bacterium]
MNERSRPPFRADHVGSLLRPPLLLAARERAARGEIARAELREVEDAAIREAVAMQEGLGLRSVTDGEFRRTYFHIDFLERFDGIEASESGIAAHFHREDGDLDFAPPRLNVTGKLGRPRSIFGDDFSFLAGATRRTPKMTIPSPSMAHFRGGRGAVDSDAYPEMDAFFADLARVYREEISDLAARGCRYLQLDDTNLAYLCDPKLREGARAIGEDPTRLPHTYARLINAALAGRPADMVTAVHLCRGNFRSAWVAEGGYDPVAEALFGEIDVDAFFLEYDTDRAGDFAPLRYVPQGKIVVLGLVSTKHATLEDKEMLKRRIDEASRFVPLERLCISPQCGFSSTVHGNEISLDDQRRKLALVVELADEVWS